MSEPDAANESEPPPRAEAAGSSGAAGDSLTGLLRVAATAAFHTGEWAAGNYARAGKRLVGAALSPQEAVSLILDANNLARDAARSLAGMANLDERVREVSSQDNVAGAVSAAVEGPIRRVVGSSDRSRESEEVLRDRGRDLLRRSSDVNYTEDAHPAYERILTELAPDEGRILRLFLLNGPQPSVDVRTGGPIGILNSDLIAPGLSMIGARAGCRYVDRVPSYLNNLHRLGLIWFSRETLQDAHRYQVIEAQPDVLAAMRSVRMAKLVRRSIHLTPFGEDFCHDCLALDVAHDAELPEHAPPAGRSVEPQPPKL